MRCPISNIRTTTVQTSSILFKMLLDDTIVFLNDSFCGNASANHLIVCVQVHGGNANLKKKQKKKKRCPRAAGVRFEDKKLKWP